MIDVCVTASTLDYIRLADIARHLGRYFHLVSPHAASRPDQPRVRLHITERELAAPYLADRERGVVISTWNSEGICQYAGIDEHTYLAVCSLLGITQWRALERSNLLRSEDLAHPPNVDCLFANDGLVQDFALFLESPHVCRGCIHFYHCLGVDSELVALQELVSEIRQIQGAGNGGFREYDYDSDPS